VKSRTLCLGEAQPAVERLGAWDGESEAGALLGCLEQCIRRVQPHAPEGVGGSGDVARDVVRGRQVRGEQRQLTAALA